MHSSAETSRKRGDLGDDVEDDKSLVGRSISSRQQDGTNQHQGSCEDRAPLAPNLVTKIPQSAHTENDTNNLDVVWNLDKSLATVLQHNTV